MIMAKIKLALFIVFCVILAGLFIFAKSDMANTADDFANQSTLMNDNKGVNSKAQFDKQYNYQNSIKVAEDSSSSGDQTAYIKDGQLVAKEHGQLITDTSINPSGLPLYDGWTMSVDDLKSVAANVNVDPNSIKSWDLDIQQFWATDDFKDNPGLYGLGDFTNSKPGSKNLITIGGVSGYYKGKIKTIDTSKGKVSTYDGRVLFAVGGRVYTDPDLLNDELMTKLSDPCGLTRTSPEWSKRDFSNCYKVTYSGDENMIHDWSNCVPNNTDCKGVYFDILFDDGTVLAAIMADGKGVHMGGDKRGSWSDDVLMQGFGHVRFKRNNPDVVGYQSILELYGSGCQNNGLDINLSSKKIVGIRTYKVTGVRNNSFMNWFSMVQSK